MNLTAKHLLKITISLCSELCWNKRI